MYGVARRDRGTLSLAWKREGGREQTSREECNRQTSLQTKCSQDFPPMMSKAFSVKRKPNILERDCNAK
jgi:hypothetical protein